MAHLPEDHHCAWREEAERLGRELERVTTEFNEKFASLAAQMQTLQRHVFGKRSEKMPRVEEALKKTGSTNTEESSLALRRANAERKAELPSREIRHTIPEEKRICPKCGARDFRPLGEGKVTTVYEYIPARFEKQVHIQETLSCRCGQGILVAEGAPKVVEKGQYGAGFMAHLVTAKCADSIPLHRLSKAYRRTGIPIARTTLGDLFHATALCAQPLSRRLLELVAQDEVVQADETPVRVQAKGKTRKSYIWTFRAGKLIAFRYSPSRSGDTPAEVLGGTKGSLVVDGYTGYNRITLPEGRQRVGCWAHVRRKFFDALSTAPEAQAALDFILELYRVEYKAKAAEVLGTDEHRVLRQTESTPVVQRIREWLGLQTPRHPPKSPMGEAIRYATGQWESLTRFLDNSKLPLDNNASEGALRPIALGRKNFLFVGTDEAGEHIAGLYSLVATCEANGVNPQEYLADVLIRVQTHPNARIDELLPHLWAKSRPATAAA